MNRTLVWVKIPKLCHKFPAIYLFSQEREGIPAKMPTNKESIYFSRISHFSHHNSNALINLIQHQPTNYFWEHLVTHFSNFADQL